MPADWPGKLSKTMNADILAYILEANKFPAGAKDLPPGTAALQAIRIEAARKSSSVLASAVRIAACYF